MKFSQYCTLIVFAACVSILTVTCIQSEDAKVVSTNSTEDAVRQCSSCSNLNLDTICARVALSECSKVNQLTAQKACIDDLQATEFCVDSANFSTLCSTTAQLNNLCSNNMNTNALCATLACTGTVWSDTSITGTACVSTQLYQCSYLSARVSLSTNTTYTLGNPVNFNQINSDPSGSILSSPTRYKLPYQEPTFLQLKLRKKIYKDPTLS